VIPVGIRSMRRYLNPMEGIAPSLTGVVSLAIWLYLLAARGGFWRAGDRLDGAPPNIESWPDVIAIVPARDEADVIAMSVTSLVAQDYPGRLDIVVVDDHSSDDTAERAMSAGQESSRHVQIVSAASLPPDWAGKVWAMSQGLKVADRLNPDAPYIWLSDADITHESDNLRRLVAKAERDDCDMVSQMVTLASNGAWASLLIPAFVYFFQKLYPFRWVNTPRNRTAAAAGGCVLLRRDSLERAGGFSTIQGALIDDCALAQAVKDRGREGGGRLHLALTHAARSLRPYHGLGGVWHMVARSAFVQLRHSSLLLAGTLTGMALTYLAPPIVLLTAPWHTQSSAVALAGLGWALMAMSFTPTLRYYGKPLLLAPMLPLAGLLYSAMTLDSAVSHWRGRGGAWKGRTRPSAATTSLRKND